MVQIRILSAVSRGCDVSACHEKHIPSTETVASVLKEVAAVVKLNDNDIRQFAMP